MNKINTLTETQYNILSMCSDEWCYPFSYFDDLNLSKKELSKEFKILREAGLVEFERGLINEEGYTAGSGYCLNDSAKNEIAILLENYKEIKP